MCVWTKIERARTIPYFFLYVNSRDKFYNSGFPWLLFLDYKSEPKTGSSIKGFRVKIGCSLHMIYFLEVLMGLKEDGDYLFL